MTGRSPFTLTAARALELSKDNTAQILRRNSLGVAMTMTPEELRDLADRAYEACLNPYADALMAAADEIERLQVGVIELREKAVELKNYLEKYR